MPESIKLPFAQGRASDLLILYIPSHDRDQRPIDQDALIEKTLDFIARTFHKATAFTRARGVWRDDDHDGKLIYDEPVVIQCYTTRKLLEEKSAELGQFLLKLGRENNQGAVGFVINDQYFEIPFPDDKQR